jgi:hypothetical protein
VPVVEPKSDWNVWVDSIRFRLRFALNGLTIAVGVVERNLCERSHRWSIWISEKSEISAWWRCRYELETREKGKEGWKERFVSFVLFIPWVASRRAPLELHSVCVLRTFDDNWVFLQGKSHLFVHFDWIKLIQIMLVGN